MLLDRLTSLLVFLVLGASFAGYVLGTVGLLFLGPTLILGAVLAYTLWTLWWGVVDGPGAARTSHRATGYVIVCVVAAALFAGWFAGTNEIPLDRPGAMQANGRIAAQTGELAIDAPLVNGSSVVGPGLRPSGGGAVLDGGRLGVAAAAILSWFGDTGVRIAGAVFLAVAALSWGTVASRRLPAWIAGLVVLAMGVAPALAWAGRSSGSVAVAAAVAGASVWALAGMIDHPTVARSAIAGALVALTIAAHRPSGWVLVAAVIAWAFVWRLEPSGWIERDRRRKSLLALGGGAALPGSMVVLDAVLRGDAGDLLAAAGIPVATAAIVAVLGMGWHRLGIRRPASPLPFLVVALAVPVSYGIVTVGSTGGSGALGGPAIAAWLGAGPVLVAAGLAGWLWTSDRHAEPLTELIVMVGIVGATGALLGPVELLPGGLEPIAPLMVPVLAIGAGWLVDVLFRDPERAVLQTTALVVAAALLAVPFLVGWRLLTSRPSEVAPPGVQALCRAFDDDFVVVVAADDVAAGQATALAVAITARCGVPASAVFDGGVDRWDRAAAAEDRILSIVVLDGAVPDGLEPVPGPILEVTSLRPTVGTLPDSERMLILPTGLAGAGG